MKDRDYDRPLGVGSVGVFFFFSPLAPLLAPRGAKLSHNDRLVFGVLPVIETCGVGAPFFFLFSMDHSPAHAKGAVWCFWCTQKPALWEVLVYAYTRSIKYH